MKKVLIAVFVFSLPVMLSAQKAAFGYHYTFHGSPVGISLTYHMPKTPIGLFAGVSIKQPDTTGDFKSGKFQTMGAGHYDNYLNQKYIRVADRDYWWYNSIFFGAIGHYKRATIQVGIDIINGQRTAVANYSAQHQRIVEAPTIRKGVIVGLHYDIVKFLRVGAMYQSSINKYSASIAFVIQ